MPSKCIITLSHKTMFIGFKRLPPAYFPLFIRLLAFAAIGTALTGVFSLALASPAPKVIDTALASATALGVGIYGTVLAIKTNRSPKTLAGFSITYHTIAIGLAFLAWFSVWLLAILTGVFSAGSLLSPGSSLLTSQVSSGSSSVASFPAGTIDAVGVFFILYTVSAILFLILGTAKIVFSLLYSRDHGKWKTAYKILIIVTTLIWFLALLSLGLVAAFLNSVQSGFLPENRILISSGASLGLLFGAQDLAFITSPEMNFSFEEGMTPKE